jgi:hypothetical protein
MGTACTTSSTSRQWAAGADWQQQVAAETQTGEADSDLSDLGFVSHP